MRSSSKLSVNYKGVRRVRLGLNSAAPPITRVVVEMDEAHPYDLQSDGSRVTLVIGPAPNAIASSGQGAQAAGASGGWSESFDAARHRLRWRPAMTLPPDCLRHHRHLPPINFPEEQAGNAASSTSASASSRPTASHPDRGSLQEGTVFPGLGSPGTGNVPDAKASSASGTANASGSRQSGGVTTTPGAFQPRVAADSGFPTVVVTPGSTSNSEIARQETLAPPAPQPTPEELSRIVPSRPRPVSTATVVAVAPQPALEALSHATQPRYPPVSTSRLAVEPPAQSQAGSSTASTQGNAGAIVGPSSEPVDVQTRAAIATQPASQTAQAPPTEPPGAPDVAEPEPEPGTAASVPENSPRSQPKR